MQNWKELLTEERKNEDFFHIAFLNKYESIIPGPNRDAKRKRVTRYIENLNFQENQEVVEEAIKPEKAVFESSILDSPEYNVNVKGSKIVFGLIGDTHFGSKYVQMTYLNDFYDICAKQGITEVYHTGDITDGENMRPGHAYENYVHGADEHIKEIERLYPYRKGITTHFITGNHDASFRKSCGLDIGNLIQSRRSDLKYLGRDVANINITNNVTMQLRHPWSASAYALSYRSQKIVESMEASYLDKPAILCIGHFHKMEYLYYHNVHVFQTGCFQGATPFTTGKGISISMGGWIIAVELDSENKLKSITPTAIVFDEPIKEDYKKFYL